MYWAHILHKNLEKEKRSIYKKEKDKEKGTIYEKEKEKGMIYEKEIFKMNCGFCGQQSYFCVCSDNLVQKI